MIGGLWFSLWRIWDLGMLCKGFWTCILGGKASLVKFQLDMVAGLKKCSRRLHFWHLLSVSLFPTCSGKCWKRRPGAGVGSVVEHFRSLVCRRPSPKRKRGIYWGCCSVGRADRHKPWLSSLAWTDQWCRHPCNQHLRDRSRRVKNSRPAGIHMTLSQENRIKTTVLNL